MDPILPNPTGIMIGPCFLVPCSPIGLEYKVQKRQDIIEKIMLDDYNIARIANISLYQKETNTVLYTISDVTINMYSALINHKACDYLTLPMLPFPLYSLPQSVHVHVKLKTKTSNPGVSHCVACTDITRDLCDIISAYVGLDYIDGKVEIMAFSRVVDIDRLRKTPRTQKHMFLDEKLHTIAKGTTELDIDVTGWHLITQIVWGFHDGTSYLPILQSGNLIPTGVMHTTLTHTGAHVLDKMAHDLPVPIQPIYSVTFDNIKDLENPNRFSCGLNVSRIGTTRLRMKIAPQSRDIELHMYSHCLNRFVLHEGTGALQYTR